MRRTWGVLVVLASLPARAEGPARAPEWAVRGGGGLLETVSVSASIWPEDWFEAEVHGGTSFGSWGGGARVGPRLHLGGRPLRHEVDFTFSAGALVGMRWLDLREPSGAYQGLAPNAVGTLEIGMWSGPEGGWALQLVAGATWANTGRPGLAIPDFRVSIARLH